MELHFFPKQFTCPEGFSFFFETEHWDGGVEFLVENRPKQVRLSVTGYPQCHFYDTVLVYKNEKEY